MRPVRERIIQAGTNWCAHTHGHSGEKAALAAAAEAVRIAREMIDDGVDVGQSRAYSMGYCDANDELRNQIDDLLLLIEGQGPIEKKG